MIKYFSQFPEPFNKPFEHQVRTILHFLRHERTHCWNGTGTGKTACILWAFDILRKKGLVRKLLVVSTKSSLYATWGKHVFIMLPTTKKAVLIGTKEVRANLLDRDLEIAIINHDGIKVCGKDLIAWRPDFIVIDESTAFKRKSTARWKAMAAIVSIAKRVICMTGTPFAQEPTDIWAPSLFVCPDDVGSSFYRFRLLTMYQVNRFKWIAKPNVEEIVKRYVKPVIYVKRDSCLDLPPVQYIDEEVEFSEEQANAFTRLKNEAVALIEAGTITAVHAGALRIKLLQCCCGYVYGENKDRERINVDLNPKHRLEFLLETIDECERGVLVFTSFRVVVEKLHSVVRSKNISCSYIHGDVSMNERHRAIDEFQKGGIKVLILHPKTMAHSVTLTYADTVIWYEVTSDNELYEQANARINRMGQNYKMRVIHFVSSRFEKLVLQKLRAKQSTQTVILEAFGEKNDK